MPTALTEKNNLTSKAASAKPPIVGDKKSKMTPISAFALHPDRVHFETQEAEETVELFLRQHPVVNVPWLFLTGILVVAPLFVFPILLRLMPFAVPAGYTIVGLCFWYLATFGFILTNFLHWFFNIYIVTNERIVDVDFKYLLYKHFAEAELDKIQDISYTSSGLPATIFNHGNVLVQTAGEVPNIDFDTVPHPEKVVETIRSLIEKIQKERSGK